MKGKHYLWQPEQVTITKIIDGDTIKVEIDMGFGIKTNQTLRLLGINTPEIKGASKAEGLKSREYLISSLFEKDTYDVQKSVRLITYKQGKYGRYLVDVYVGDLHVNKDLVDKGYAIKFME